MLGMRRTPKQAVTNASAAVTSLTRLHPTTSMRKLKTSMTDTATQTQVPHSARAPRFISCIFPCPAHRRVSSPHNGLAERAAHDKVAGMSHDQPSSTFLSRSDAACLLLGLGGFWGGIASLLMITLIEGGHNRSLWALLPVVVTIVSVFVLQRGIARVVIARTGKPPLRWPRGPSVGDQIDSTSPGTLATAARRLSLPGRLVAWSLYGLLLVDAGLLVALASRR